jgi:hypothetical protein
MKEQFSGASTDDAAAHLNNFVELCEMQKYKDVESDIDEDIGTPGQPMTRNIKSKVVLINKRD